MMRNNSYVYVVTLMSVSILFFIGFTCSPDHQLHASPSVQTNLAVISSVRAIQRPVFQVTPQSIDFGSLKAEQSKTDTVTVTNGGDETLIISSAVVTDSSFFNITPAHGSVFPADSMKFYITFTVPPNVAIMKMKTPTWYWTTTGFAFFKHNAGNVNDSINLSGTAYLLLYEVPTKIDFGSVVIGNSKYDSIVTIDGHSRSSFTIDSVISDNPDFSVTPRNGFVSPSGNDTFYVTFHPLTSGPQKANIVFWYSQQGSPDTVAVTGIGAATLTNIVTASGWNMLSIPREVDDYAKNVIFPNSISDAYRFTSAYSSEAILKNGIGYWVKFPSRTSISLTGMPCYTETVAVNRGWNLIGSISEPIAVASIMSESPTMIVSNIYSYSNDYVVSDTIKPGMGYWIHSNQAGFLILSSNPSQSTQNRLKIVPTTQRPPLPPGQVDSRVDVPSEYALKQAFPNPFNPSTIITYQLPFESKVTLKLYNLLGENIEILVDEIQMGGYRSVKWNASGFASGVYFYKFEARNVSNGGRAFVSVKKMLLLK